MKTIPERSAVLSVLANQRATEIAQEVDRIGDIIVDNLNKGHTIDGALVYGDGKTRLSAKVSDELTRTFAAKGWHLVCTNGVDGGCAIFLAK
jgi:hypothetical protein